MRSPLFFAGQLRLAGGPAPSQVHATVVELQETPSPHCFCPGC